MSTTLASPDLKTGRAAKRVPVSLLTPDERLRFVKEADAAREQFENFDWRDTVGRKWAIRPGIVAETQVVLFQCARDNRFREWAIPWDQYTAAKAETVIDKLDQAEIWRA